MEDCNNLGKVIELVDRTVFEASQKQDMLQSTASDVCNLMSRVFPKWNWTVLCGDKFDVCTEGHGNSDIMLSKRYPNNLRVIVLRGSSLEPYTGGPAVISVRKNELLNSDDDLAAIRAAIEASPRDMSSMVENTRKYFKERYPGINWVVIAGDDFALNPDFEQMASIVFCGTVGHISIVIVKADVQI